jgi:hypothetical protein
LLWGVSGRKLWPRQLGKTREAFAGRSAKQVLITRLPHNPDYVENSNELKAFDSKRFQFAFWGPTGNILLGYSQHICVALHDGLLSYGTPAKPSSQPLCPTKALNTVLPFNFLSVTRKTNAGGNSLMT